jgi:ketosteroid isomerase-like protein
MSHENVDVARRTDEAFNRRDRAAWLALQDPASECVPARDWPESDAIQGREAVWDFYGEVIGAWREAAFETVELVDAGNDKLVQQVRAEMEGKASGASVVLSYWLASTFRNGKVLRVEWFANRSEALEAAGCGSRRCPGQRRDRAADLESLGERRPRRQGW